MRTAGLGMRRMYLAGVLLSIIFGLVALASGHGPYEHPKSLWQVENIKLDLDPEVQLHVNTTEFTHQGQVVHVTWSGIARPLPSDLVALYVPAHPVDLWQTLPIHYVNASVVSISYLATGSGEATFQLLNMRGDFGFKFIRGGYRRPRVVAQAEPIRNRIKTMPTGGHLALHDDAKSMVVQWTSAQAGPQQAQWRAGSPGQRSGMAPGSTPAPGWTHTASSVRVTYKASDMCGYPANSTGFMSPGFIHITMIDASTLVSGNRYTYRFGTDEDGWSDEHSFLAPVGPGCAAGDVDCQLTFLAFNDVSQTNPLLFNDPWAGGLHFAEMYGENSSRLSAHLGGGAESQAQLALLVGDLAYALGFAADWDVFASQFEAAFTQWPLAVGTGNHEADWPNTGDAFNNAARDSGGECNVPFMHRYYSPANIRGDPRTSYYAFSQGPVHFLILDSERPSDPDSPQGRFVAADLAAVDRASTPWVIVAMHRMMVAPATWRKQWVGDLDVMERLQQDYEELFHTHQVDVVIQGHEHSYARTCPIYKLSRTSHPLGAGSSFPGSWLQRFTAWVTQLAHPARWLSRQGGNIRTGPGNGLNSGNVATSTYQAPAGGPIYILAGHAGAGFTHGFPDPLPAWIEMGVQNVNGYMRMHASRSELLIEAVEAATGQAMDEVKLVRQV